jgi:hypothetical protein
MEEIKQRRQKEILDGKNAATASPLYLVYDQSYTVCEHDTQYDQSTTVFNDSEKYVRHDHEGGEKRAEPNTDIWGEEKGKWSAVVKKSFHDRFVTVCFTRKGAEDFIKAERHNLTNPRIYVEYAERRNIELHEVLRALGDA